MTSLRYYQQQAIDSVISYWNAGGGNPLVECATGTGKSVIISGLTQHLLSSYPDMRVLMLVHQRELVKQNFKALLRAWPQAPVGINSAGLGRRDHHHQIVYASIQSVYKKAKQLGPRDLVLVDECDLIPDDGTSMYRQLLDELEAPFGIRVAGTTATPFRLNRGRIDQGKDRLFDKTVYKYDIAKGIEDGFLAPLTSKATAATIDTSKVARRGGEFVPGALEVVVDQQWLTRAAVDEIVQFGQSRRRWLVFCSGVKHANNVAEEIRSRGIECEAISNETSSSDRERILSAFESGSLRCVTNAMLLTTGFDNPQIDLIAMLRPTLSARLYLQIAGRGTRPIYPSGFNPNSATADERRDAIARGPKPDCLVLDFAGNIKRFGPVDAVEITASGGGKGDESKPLARECPTCHTLIALAARTCPTCGHIFPAPEETPKHEAVADASTSILSKGAPAWIDVDSVRYYRHEKMGSAPSIRVEYVCGFVVHKQWICLSHQGLARSKAEQWWQRCGATPVPRSTDEGLARTAELRAPVQIQIRPSGKYFEIVGRRFEAVKEVAA